MTRWMFALPLAFLTGPALADSQRLLQEPLWTLHGPAGSSPVWFERNSAGWHLVRCTGQQAECRMPVQLASGQLQVGAHRFALDAGAVLVAPDAILHPAWVVPARGSRHGH